MLDESFFWKQIDRLEEQVITVTEQRDKLLEALKLAIESHGVLLLSDPPQDAWKTRRVEAIARAAIAKAEGK